MFEDNGLGDLGWSLKKAVKSVAKTVTKPVTQAAKAVVKPVATVAKKTVAQTSRTASQAIRQAARTATQAARPVSKVATQSVNQLSRTAVQVSRPVSKIASQAAKQTQRIGTQAGRVAKSAINIPKIAIGSALALTGGAAALLSQSKGSSSATSNQEPMPSDWMQYQYINEKGQLIDAYGNVSSVPGTRGKVYYNLQGYPVDYQGNAVATDANGTNLIQKGDRYYNLTTGEEMLIDDNGIALTVSAYNAKYPPYNPGQDTDGHGDLYDGTRSEGMVYGASQQEQLPEDWMQFYYINEKRQLIDAYGNVSPKGPQPGNVYYDLQGTPVDFQGNFVVGDANDRPLAVVGDKYFDLVTMKEMWIDDETGTAVTPEEYIAKYQQQGGEGLQGLPWDAPGQDSAPLIVGAAVVAGIGYLLYKNSREGRR